MLGGRRTRWRSVLLVATVRGLGTLELDAVLLAVVALVGAAAVVAVVVRWSRVGRSRCAVLVAVVGLCGVVSWSGGPACTVEGRAAGLAPAAGGYAAVLY